MKKSLAICYHYVNPSVNSFPLIHGITPKKLEQDIEFFISKARVVLPDEIFSFHENNLKNSYDQPSVILTFDDGLKDHFKFVLPILQKRRIKASFFVPTGIFERKVLQVHKIQFILAYTFNKPHLSSEIYHYSRQHALDEISDNLVSNHRYDDFDTRKIKWILQRGFTFEHRAKLVDLLFSKYVTNDEEDFASDIYMSLEEVVELKNTGMDIGLHSHMHFHLTDLSDDFLHDEITKPKAFFEKKGIFSQTFSYPFGDTNNRVEKFIQNNSIAKAFTIIPKFFDPVKVNPLLIPRFDANDTTFLINKGLL